VIHRAAASRRVSIAQARQILTDAWDPYGDKLIAEMDSGGVDLAVVLGIDYGLVLPGADNDCRVPIEEQAIQIAEAAKRHPDRLVWGIGIDPRRTEAVSLVQRAVMELGAKAVKLYPPAGFYPNDRIVYPIYKKAVEFGLLVHFHVAPARITYLRSKYSHPIHLDDVAVDFPELKIEAVHSGGPWWRDMLAVAEARSNIFLDVGGWQTDFNRNPLECYRRVREMLDILGPGRIMWASDWTGPSFLPQASWLKAFQEIPESVKEAGIDFSTEEKEAFLGKTALKLLGLS